MQGICPYCKEEGKEVPIYIEVKFTENEEDDTYEVNFYIPRHCPVCQKDLIEGKQVLIPPEELHKYGLEEVS